MKKNVKVTFEFKLEDEFANRCVTKCKDAIIKAQKQEILRYKNFISAFKKELRTKLNLIYQHQYDAIDDNSYADSLSDVLREIADFENIGVNNEQLSPKKR